MAAILFILITALVLASAAGLNRHIPPGGHWWSSRKNKVILLYVALVGILLAIGAWQRIHTGVKRSRGVQAVSEIRNMELALTKILSDAGRSSLRDLFDADGFNAARDWYARDHGVNQFEAGVAVYSRASYALLHRGREALTAPASPEDAFAPHVRQAFRPDAVRNLGLSYFGDLWDDPWGNPYQVFPGPWPGDMGPVLFRAYWKSPEDEAYPADQLTHTLAGNPALSLGIPALRQTTVYLWSVGANGASDQPRYDPTHAYAPPARQHYREDAPEAYLGGGDDINNWDNEQTFGRFYRRGQEER